MHINQQVSLILYFNPQTEEMLILRTGSAGLGAYTKTY